MAINYSALPKGGSKHPLGLGIESIIKEERKKLTYANITKPTVWTELSKYLSTELDGDIVVYIDTEVLENASATIPMLDNNNPFLVEAMIGTHTQGMDTASEWVSSKSALGSICDGGFDLKRLKLKGFAKKIKIEYRLGFGMVHPKKRDRVTVAGATGVLAHEIGHTIQMILGVGWSARSNFVLTQAHSRLLAASDTEKRIQIYKEIAGEEKLDINDDINYVAKSNDPDLPAVVLVGAMRSEIRSELNSADYDITGAESMADNFAVNLGYGLDLALTLGKMSGYKARRTDQLARAMAVIGSQGLILALAVTPATAVMFSATWALLASYSAWDPSLALYDNPKDRVERMINTAIGNLKFNNNRDAIVNAELMLEELKYYPADTRPLLQCYHEYITMSGSTGKSIRSMQKDVESLAQHKLYIKALKFKQRA